MNLLQSDCVFSFVLFNYFLSPFLFLLCTINVGKGGQKNGFLVVIGFIVATPFKSVCVWCVIPWRSVRGGSGRFWNIFPLGMLCLFPRPRPP